MKKRIFLSLVVPAYKQERTIRKDIAALKKTLSMLPLNYEIILVVDGYVDRTLERIKPFKDRKLRVFGYKHNKGKGFAIKYGVGKSTGNIIGFIDAGMDLNPSEISMMIDIMDWNNADIVLGSKLHPDSRVKYPFFRKIMSWGYRSLTHMLFGFKVRDTQVGLKIYKGKVAKDVFSKITIRRFAFDVEVLAVAYRLGYKKIFEAPIKLDFKGISSITATNFWKIVFWMLWDTMAVFYRLRILRKRLKTSAY